MKRYYSNDQRFEPDVAYTLEEMLLIYRLSGWDEQSDGWIMSDIAILSDILRRGIEEAE